MFTNIYNLYKPTSNVNSDETLTNVMSYIASRTDDYNNDTYDAESLTEYFSQNKEEETQQVEAPSEPFSFGKPNQCDLKRIF